MTPTFNLDAIIQQENKRHRLRRLRIILVVASLTVLGWSISPLTPPNAETKPPRECCFHKQTILWHQPEGFYIIEDTDLLGRPLDIVTAATGDIWVSTGRIGTLQRTDTARWWSDWDFYGQRYWDNRGSKLRGITAVNNTFWGITDEAVIHFDGETWLAYPEALVTDQPRQIVASPNKVWVLDAFGNLSQLNDHQWTTQSLAETMPNVTWNSNSYPQLVLTTGEGQSNLWLMHEGLWRYDGTQFQPYCPYDHCFPDGQIINGSQPDQENIWIQQENETWRMSGDGQLFQNMGIQTGGHNVHEVVELENKFWFATDNGVQYWDGNVLTPYWFPPDLVTGHTSQLALLPDGSVLAVMDVNPGIRLGVFMREFAAPLLVIVLVILLFVVGLRWLGEWLAGGTKQSLVQRIKNNQLILERVSGMPDWEPPITPAELENKHTEKWIVRAGRWVVKVAISLLIVFGLPRLWPDMPEFLDIVLWFGAGLIVSTLLPSKEEKAQAAMQKRQLKKNVAESDAKDSKLDRWLIKMMPNWEQLSDTTYGRFLQSGTLIAALVLLSIFMIFVIGPLMDRIVNTHGGIVILIILGFFSLLGVAGIIFERLPAWRLMRLIKKADFAEAINQSVTLRQTPLTSASAMTGAVLAIAGEYEQAEKIARKELARTFDLTTPRAQSLLLNTLGRALTSQGRYEDAIQAIEAAILIRPGWYDLYNALAEAHLMNGTQPELAVKLAETAVRQKRRTWFWGLLIERDLYGEGYANQAWALMRLHDRKRAHRMLKRAFRWASPRSRHNLAGIHLRAGHVHLLDGDRALAVEHFTKARQIGNRGNYGRLAAKAMQNL